MSAPQKDQLPLDIEPLLADHVKDAELVVGSDTSEVSGLMFTKAVAAMSRDADSHAVFIECNSRDSLASSIAGGQLAGNPGLDHITVKYVASTDMLRALLAAWHCQPKGTQKGLVEKDFLIWNNPPSAQMPGTTEAGDAQTPGYIFIDGIDAIASENR
ncbi:hypothetical protein GGF46_000767 [Coemansia sp. RSA 552]|nr:hypothetical protein GGF46_000767 [Coemansia sp. RSA 552]